MPNDLNVRLGPVKFVVSNELRFKQDISRQERKTINPGEPNKKTRKLRVAPKVPPKSTNHISSVTLKARLERNPRDYHY